MTTPAEKEQERLEQVSKDKSTCQHTGYYVGFGMEMLVNQDGSISVITSQNCMMCGEVFVKMITLGAKKEEKKKGLLS